MLVAPPLVYAPVVLPAPLIIPGAYHYPQQARLDEGLLQQNPQAALHSPLIFQQILEDIPTPEELIDFIYHQIME